MVSITKIFTFEAAHAISEHTGQCRHVHGHSYRLEVCVSAEQFDELGMVMDFKELKQIVNENYLDYLDHALILKRDSAHRFLSDSSEAKVFLMDAEPTVEQMLLLAVDTIRPNLPERVSLVRLKLYETATSFGEWTAS